MTEQRRYSRSLSQWKALTKCGTAFELGRIKKDQIQRRPAAWSAAGSAFHEALEDWELSGRADSVADLFLTYYDHEIEKLKLQQPDLSLWIKNPRTRTVEKDIDNYRTRFVEKDCPQYEARCREAKWEILRLPSGELAIELEFELDLDGVVVKGALDRIQNWPNLGLALEDTKTGAPSNHEDDPRQLGLYALAAKECFDIEMQWGRYWFTKVDRGSDWTDLSQWSRDWYVEQFHILDKTIQQGLFLANPGSGCNLCDVQPWCPVKGYLKLGEKM